MEWREAGWSSEDRLAFDFGMVWFGQWVEARRSETVQVKRPKHDDGMMSQPKYGSLADIFEQYDDTWAMTKFVPPPDAISEDDLAAVIEAAFGDEILF